MAKFVSLIAHGLRKKDCHAVTISENSSFSDVRDFLSIRPGYYMIEEWGLRSVRYYFTDANVAFEFKMRFA